MFRALALLVITGGALGCAEDGEGEFGALDPCLTAQATLLGCPPPGVGDREFTIEDACAKMVDCGALGRSSSAKRAAPGAGAVFDSGLAPLSHAPNASRIAASTAGASKTPAT